MNPDDAAIRDQLERSALLADLVGPVVHEVNNFLNTLLLQAAISDSRSPANPTLEVGFVRQECQRIVKLLRDWQSLSKKQPAQPALLDLNVVVAQIPRPESPPIHLETDGERLCVEAPALELRGICTLLVQALARGFSNPPNPARSLTVRTGKKDKHVLLQIRDNGPALPATALAELFDPVRSVGSGIELAACASLSRRIQGRLSAENDAKGGVAISLLLPAATTP